MILFKKATDITNYLLQLKQTGKTIGFVPTMGALHAGHISLINTSKMVSDVTVCSIFVNPAQFNDVKDFNNYPTTIERDIDILEKAGCDILFLPPVGEIYPDGIENMEKYNLGYLETVLEGKYRPGHFQGVCMVVHRLLNVIPAHRLFLGQKDYQQCMIIKKLVELKNIDIEIKICPTLRENDGLAMSSRNVRLPEAARKNATGLFEALVYLKSNITSGNLQALKIHAAQILSDNGFKTDYIEIVDATKLDILNNWNGDTKIVAVAAAFLGEVRLIDNMLLEN